MFLKIHIQLASTDKPTSVIFCFLLIKSNSKRNLIKCLLWNYSSRFKRANNLWFWYPKNLKDKEKPPQRAPHFCTIQRLVVINGNNISFIFFSFLRVIFDCISLPFQWIKLSFCIFQWSWIEMPALTMLHKDGFWFTCLISMHMDALMVQI